LLETHCPQTNRKGGMVMTKSAQILEVVCVYILITLAVIPIALTFILLVPVHYCFELRLQNKEKDKFNT
jgi:hypothetical protein